MPPVETPCEELESSGGGEVELVGDEVVAAYVAELV